MQINNNNKKRQQDIPDEIEEDIEIKRDLELENIAGNLMIAEYQVDKLRHRLSQQVRSAVYHPFGTKKHLLILSSIMANGTRFQLR
jgi:hypothetical protein